MADTHNNEQKGKLNYQLQYGFNWTKMISVAGESKTIAHLLD